MDGNRYRGWGKTKGREKISSFSGESVSMYLHRTAFVEWKKVLEKKNPSRRLRAREGSCFSESSVIIRDKILIELSPGMFLSALFNTPVTRVF